MKQTITRKPLNKTRIVSKFKLYGGTVLLLHLQRKEKYTKILLLPNLMVYIAIWNFIQKCVRFSSLMGSNRFKNVVQTRVAKILFSIIEDQISLMFSHFILFLLGKTFDLMVC